MNDEIEKMLSEILVEENIENLSKIELYIKLKEECDKYNKKTSELLFQNIKLGEERGKLETQIKIQQSKVDALKSAEKFIELTTEDVQNKISQVSSVLREFEDDIDIINFNKNTK